MISYSDTFARGTAWKAPALRWLLSFSLLLSVAAPVTSAESTRLDESLSVLDLQRLVDTMLLDHGEPTSATSSSIVLDLQRALMNSVQSDSPHENKAPAPHEGAVLPPSYRFFIPAIPATPRSLFIPERQGHAAVYPHPSGAVPLAAGPRVRYQFHLLSNAPPGKG
mgnify:CR=1 FL=1